MYEYELNKTLEYVQNSIFDLRHAVIATEERGAHGYRETIWRILFHATKELDELTEKMTKDFLKEIEEETTA